MPQTFCFLVAQPHWSWPEEKRQNKTAGRCERERRRKTNSALPNYWPQGNMQRHQNVSTLQSNFWYLHSHAILEFNQVLDESSLVFSPGARLSRSYSNVPATLLYWLKKDWDGSSTANVWTDGGTHTEGGEGVAVVVVGVSGLAWHFKAGHQRVSAVSLWWTQRVGLSCRVASRHRKCRVSEEPSCVYYIPQQPSVLELSSPADYIQKDGGWRLRFDVRVSWMKHNQVWGGWTVSAVCTLFTWTAEFLPAHFAFCITIISSSNNILKTKSHILRRI